MATLRSINIITLISIGWWTYSSMASRTICDKHCSRMTPSHSDASSHPISYCIRVISDQRWSIICLFDGRITLRSLLRFAKSVFSTFLATPQLGQPLCSDLLHSPSTWTERVHQNQFVLPAFPVATPIWQKKTTAPREVQNLSPKWAAVGTWFRAGTHMTCARSAWGWNTPAR